jgi:class 3 adenylate cyclase/tetratricopeptide (TPR) repeat protein
VRCLSCDSENPDNKTFCGDCGSPLGKVCPNCQAENPSGKQFCADCGSSLNVHATDRAGTASTASAGRLDTRHAADPRGAERRHLTVLFCDLAGSTEIASGLDPEEWRETVAGYHRAAAGAITRFGGHVAKFLGDGVMAFFGYPEAHENDGERAARAGLAIIDAIARLNDEAAFPKLAARVGIDSGAVVVGTGAGQEIDVFGDTPNTAARVQAVALPGTVVVTANTYRLLAGLFIVEDLGAQTLKGITGAASLYQIIRPSGMRGRLAAAAAVRGMTSFVGREEELRLLIKRWEYVCEGEGHVVTIVGEAGIGKSRLLQRFREEIAATPFTWLECTTASFFQNTPFYAVADMMHQSFRWDSKYSVEQRFTTLEASLIAAGIDPKEAVPYIAPLLDLPLGDRYPIPSIPPDQQRKKLLATLVAWVFAAAKAQPLVIATEDLHWADPSTLELTQLLVEQGARARLMLLYTSRPEFRIQWPLRAHHTQITLNRLSAKNVRMMVREVAAQHALSDQAMATVIDRTGGVPLFVEELTRAVLEHSDSRLTGGKIPVTLQDSLMARLDRLGSAKEVIQIGAVIGAEFPYELLHIVHPIGEAELQRALMNLADAELLYVRGIPPEATYQFRHALIQDAAYEALLKSRRKELHRLVAHTITSKLAAFGEANPEVLARHWGEAGETELAIADWSRAGKAAQARNAFREAQECHMQALRLVHQLPQSSTRDLLELELRQSVVRLLWMISGYSAPETIDATEQAAALAEKSGQLPQLVTWVILRCTTALVSGDLGTLGSLLDQAHKLAIREGSAKSLGNVHELQIVSHFIRGSLADSEKHFSAGAGFFENPDFKQLPGAAIAAYGWASWNAWILGRPNLAHARMSQMMAVVNPESHYDIAFSGVFAATLNCYLSDYDRALMIAENTLETSEKYKFPYLAAVARCILGRVRAELGQAPEGILLLRQGIRDLPQLGSTLRMSNFMGWMAASQALGGEMVGAVESIEKALQMNAEEIVFRPELLNLRGHLRSNQGDKEEARADFHEAIALAQSIGAKSWELRAKMSLARLLEKQDRRDEARVVLTEIYTRFTEGFDTADLKQARTLLDELSA